MHASKLQNNLVLKITIAAAISFGLAACQKGELDELREAQYCLNKAGTGQAAACVTGLRSKSSQEASKLVCASIYIDDGFGSPAQIADAISRISEPGGSCTTSCSGSLNAMTTLKFSGSPIAVAKAKLTDATNFCSKSGVTAYATITAFFGVGTLMSQFDDLGPGSTPTEITDALAAIEPAELGNVILQTYGASCADPENVSESNQEFCTEMALAVNSTNGSPAAVGACLQARLADPNLTVCP